VQGNLMLGYENIIKIKLFAQISSAILIMFISLVYVLIIPFLKKIHNSIKLESFDYTPKLNELNTGNSIMFRNWGQNNMEIPVRTYTLLDNKLSVEFTKGDYPYVSGGPSPEYSWVWISEKNRMGWSNKEPNSVVTLILSDGFGDICDKICKGVL